MRDISNGGITVSEAAGSDQPIVRLPTATTGFVGRALRGPVNQPVRVRNCAEFHQVFGGLWQPGMLGYAVEQYFDNGGREAVIVRVVNGGAPATITPAVWRPHADARGALPWLARSAAGIGSTTTTSPPAKTTASTSSCSASAPSARNTSRTRKSSGACRPRPAPRVRHQRSAGIARWCGCVATCPTRAPTGRSGRAHAIRSATSTPTRTGTTARH